MKKLLVFGIIALFVGLAFIPSFNAVSISKDIEETKPVLDDIEKDCDCQFNGKTHLAEKLIYKLEKNEVLSNVIGLENLEDDRPICILLKSLATHFANLYYKYFLLVYSSTFGTLKYWIYFLLMMNSGAIGIFILKIYSSLSCGE
jgi:hypothetical protein